MMAPPGIGTAWSLAPWRVVWCLLPLALAFTVRDRFTLEVLALASTQALYVASWDLLAGLSGQVSLGHALPFGSGAYIAALALGGGRLPPAEAMVSAALAGAIAGALQGKLGAHLHRISLALLTLAMAECAHELSGMLRFAGPGGVIVGGDGGVPGVVFPPGEAQAARLTAAVLAAGLFGLLWIAHSKVGLAMRTVRADDRVAAVSGIDAAHVRVVAFALAGGIAGLAGGFTAALAGRASPSMLSVEPSLFALAVAGVGGLGTIIGPAGAAFALTAVLQWIDIGGPVRLALYAVLLIVVGLVVAPEEAIRWGARRDSAEPRFTVPKYPPAAGLASATALTTAAGPPLLRAEDVVRRFDGAIVLNSLWLSLAAGESLGLTGPNGCGKTTLVDIISGFLRPDRGRVWFAGRDITRWPPHHIVHAGIGRTFQRPRLSFRLTVEQNIQAATLHRLKGREATEVVSRVLELVGLHGLRRREGRTLSLGQMRRVEVARALATGPRLLLLDEPFASLSPKDVPDVLSVLRRLRAEGMSMVIVAHSYAVFQAVCDRVAVIEGGRVVRTHDPGEISRA